MWGMYEIYLLCNYGDGKQEWNSIDSLSSNLPSHVTFIVDS
jgi:hypothetical protein